MNYDGTPTGKYIPVKETVSYRDLLKHNSINCSSVLLLRDVAAEFPWNTMTATKTTLHGLRFCANTVPLPVLTARFLNIV